MSTNLQKLIDRRDLLLRKVIELNKEIDVELKKPRRGFVNLYEGSNLSPTDYPHGDTWATKCIYILKEARGKKLTAQQITGRLIRYHKGVWRNHSIGQVLQGLRKFPQDGFKSAVVNSSRVFWIGNEEDVSTSEISVLKSCGLPASFGGRSLALVHLSTGSRSAKILLPDGTIDNESGKVTRFLRKLNKELELGVDFFGSGGDRPLTPYELGKAVMTAIDAKGLKVG